MSDTIKKHIYFASDFHLGAPTYEKSLEREKQIVTWLNSIQSTAKEIFLVGDIFDFWFEYKRAIPKGFVRLQGKLAELTDSGIPVHIFTGNHDMWIFDYIPKELGVQLHREPIQRKFGDKKFYIGHGDGLGPGDHSYKLLKKIFNNKFCQWSFARLHPNFGIWLADSSSKKSRAKSGGNDETFLGEENEWLAIYSKEILQKEHFDYFIYGHRHLPLEIKLSESSTYINLGDWLKYFTFLEFDGEKAILKSWNNGNVSNFEFNNSSK
jgi:UDP-2,3-diacylglucosamine hydrolase